MGLFSTKKKSAIAGLFGEKITREQLLPEVESAPEPVEPVEASESKEPAAEPDQDDDASDQETSTKEPALSEEAKKEQTIFFGNLSSAVILDKAAFKQFKTFARQAGPVVSIRFRSIAFSEILPRKAAYILQKLHPARDSVNAYVVYKTPEAAKAALALNGLVFLDHHVRVDSAAHPAPQFRKRSVFLGNMDFEAKEEDVYRHFEACGPIEYVRLVRDAKTNVGKGFGYVQFKDAAAVSLAIMMSGTAFNGRPLRVTHCKGDKDKAKEKAKNENSFKVHKGRKERKPRTRTLDDGTVLEGERAQKGKTSLKTRKPRHRNDPSKKKKAK